eukprot:CAMPEP_0185195960 /NCGR_PEP_ID=MMETSP1140-20130426/36199_1 /TAXON_ID=298111 /ORGANISM="Pavlova sp., Strain CCMP459" /LENGTH=115 /DNA_ID=CAMNT_0027762957 /DNA_START=260 /DNA_END=608 /DNA_ORIENTATION=-
MNCDENPARPRLLGEHLRIQPWGGLPGPAGARKLVHKEQLRCATPCCLMCSAGCALCHRWTNTSHAANERRSPQLVGEARVHAAYERTFAVEYHPPVDRPTVVLIYTPEGAIEEL